MATPISDFSIESGEPTSPWDILRSFLPSIYHPFVDESHDTNDEDESSALHSPQPSDNETYDTDNEDEDIDGEDEDIDGEDEDIDGEESSVQSEEPEVDWFGSVETIYPFDHYSSDFSINPLNEDSESDTSSYPPSDTIQSPDEDSGDVSPMVTYVGNSWESVYFPSHLPRPPSLIELNSWEMSDVSSHDAVVPSSFEGENWDFFNRFE
jgi:hypothetical protein